MSTYEGPVITCALCERKFAADAIWKHLDVVHGIQDIAIEEWPDGSPVIIDNTLEPEDFRGDGTANREAGE